MSSYFKARHQGHRAARFLLNAPIKPIRQVGAYLLWPQNRDNAKTLLKHLGGYLLIFGCFYLLCVVGMALGWFG